jgi:hypothetical protein
MWRELNAGKITTVELEIVVGKAGALFMPSMETEDGACVLGVGEATRSSVTLFSAEVVVFGCKFVKAMCRLATSSLGRCLVHARKSNCSLSDFCCGASG